MMKLLRTTYVLFFGLLAAFSAGAFSPDVYSPQSVLSSGKWVKVSVKTSGMHCIPTATLKKWGFSDPKRVRVYGYGGRMLSDILEADSYIDDLPLVATAVTAKGLVFYGEGPEQIDVDARGEASHSVNPYSRLGYYFLTEGEAPAIARGGTALDSSADCQTSANWLAYYDPQVVSVGNSGRMMVGEDFRSQRTRSFTLELPGLKAGTTATVRASLVANVPGATTSVTLSADATPLPSQSKDVIEKGSSESGFYANHSIISKTFKPSGSKTVIGITLSTSGVMKDGWLDYVEVDYERTFGGSQVFMATQPNVASTGAGNEWTHVWDVTDPTNHYELNVGKTGAWRNDRGGVRRYAVWSENDVMPAPELAGNVYNQNLHAMTSVPDMVIITPEAYAKAANTIADIHRNYPLDSLTVEVVRLDPILNEFGSGSFDPGAIRRFLKMLYDRSSDSAGRLRYVLLMGKGTCDNRALTSVGAALRAPMPLWVSENSLSDSNSFSSDDYFAFLDDGSGARPARDKLCVALGRIPATSAEEANIAAEKINRYLYNMPQGAWRTRMTVLADDENRGDHMIQADTLVNNMQKGPNGSRMVVDKIYCDAYRRQNSTYPQARNDVFRNFDDGMAIFTFIGHGSPTALGSKNIIQPTDFRKHFFLKRLPFFYAATCSFLKWDTNITSQAETLMFQRDGGLIGCISALRPVYITQNGLLSAAFGTVLGQFDESGRMPTAGELYRCAKNRLTNDSNKLRYVYMGDPALRLVMPSNLLTLDAINGVAVTDSEPYTLMARQDLTLTGRVTDTDGNLLSDFNGTVTATLYDAEFSTTSYGYGENSDGIEYTFEEIGDMLFVATGQAKNGVYELNVRMPQNVANNFRPATLSLYANSTRSGDMRQAAGLSRNVYAFGYDDSTPDDNQPPVIHSALLNDENFADGNDVNPAPLLVARVSDNTGINMSLAGIGQKMTLTIDGRTTYDNLSSYFVLDSVATGGAMSGVLYYNIPEMTDGPHSLQLRVWDIDGNFADANLQCNVRADLKPEIYEVFTNDSPARTEARFYVRHNRPDQIVDLRVAVYDLMGRQVWSSSVESRSDMELSSPMVWDLRNSGGHRVPRGIYVYRVELANGTGADASQSKKLAVAAE